MASRPIAPHQQAVRAGGLNKQQHPENQKKTMGENKIRRALGDIGNLAAGIPAPEIIPGKQITRPLTRSFRAQLLANAQAAAAADNNKKQICVNVDTKPTKKAALVATKRPTAAVPKPKPKPPVTSSEEVIVISPESEIKSNKKKCQERSKNKSKKLQTLTSILTTSSKLACKPKEKEVVFNIDASDAGNHLAAVEYVEDIYKFYKLSENESRAISYMGSQPEINTRMRSILIDWLIDVHQKFDLSRETLYLTINIIDRFLSVKTVPRKELQLVGISATLTAAKYEEIWPPEVNELVIISDRAYSGQQILAMEKTILANLEWTLTVPTQFVFLTRFAKAAAMTATATATTMRVLDREVEHMASYLSELGLMDYECSVMFPPSMAAAAAVYTARRVMNRVPVWTDVLEFHTGYSEIEVRDCGRVLVDLMGKVKDGKLKTVFHKYSSSTKGSVALIPMPSPAAI